MNKTIRTENFCLPALPKSLRLRFYLDRLSLRSWLNRFAYRDWETAGEVVVELARFGWLHSV